MAHEKHFIHGIVLEAVPADGTGHDILTRDPATGLVTKISGSPLLATLPEGQFWIGNSSNIATPVLPSGDVTFNTSGLFDITPGVIVNADISATADIEVSKLESLVSNRLVITDGTGKLTVANVTDTEASFLSGASSNIQTQLNAKQTIITGAATTITSNNLTANRAVISNASGKVSVSAATSAEVAHLSGVHTPIQTQLDAKLTVSLTSVAQGDLVMFNGSQWVNLGKGTDGQVLTATATSIAWDDSSASGLPTGGTTNQYLKKNSNTNFDTVWDTLELSDITDITASAAEVNILTGATLTTAELNFVAGVTSPIQSQLNEKQSRSLGYNNLWVGGAANIAVQLPPGADGEVLTVVGGSPQWQPFPITGGGVAGPGASTDNAIARWNGITGIAIQNSGVIIDDSDNITGINSMTLQDGAGIRTGSTNGDTVLLQAYDVDGGSYTTFATLTAANAPTFDLHTATTIDMSYIYRVGGTDVSLADGGTGASLSDPGADAVYVWDDTLNQTRLATLDGLTYDSGTNILTATGGGGSGHTIENDGTPLTDRNNLNFSNGLTASDNNPDTDVKLGGSLSGNTTIDGASSFNFALTNTPTISLTATTSVQVGLSTNNILVDATGVQLDFGSAATGDLFYENASNYLSRVPIGTTGQILTVSSSGIPEWDDAPITYTDTDARDAVGNIFVDSSTIDFTYNDGTPSITGIVIDNSISNSKFRQSSALSVVARSANSTGNVADLSASANGQVLMRASDALSFALLTGANFSNASANTFFAGPIAGSASPATFRVIDPTDMPFPSRTQSGTTYTILSSDHGQTIYFTDPSGCTVTLPTGLPDDFWFTGVREDGAGTITFVASGSSDLNTVNNEVTIDFANGAVSWEYRGDSNGFDWYGFGALGSLSGGGGGSGTVTSVNNSNITGLATATGGPITGSGTLGYTLDNQSANTIFAGPESGSASAPAFRLMSMLDIPRPAKTVATSTYTVVDDDLGHNIYFTNSTGCVVTLDDAITVPNFWFLAIKDKAMTAGTVQFTNGGSSAILNTVDGETDIISDNGAVSWEYKGSGDWYGWGTLGGGSSGGGGGHTIKNSGTTLADRPNINFRNGITAVDLNPDIAVGLGGSLVADTTINADSHDFKITAIDEFLIQRSGTNRIEMAASGAIHLHTGGDTASSITLHPTNGITVTAKGAGFSSGSMVVVDSTGSLINFGPSTSSLIGKNAAGSFTSVNASNGITHDATANTLKLGGALTGLTTISGAFGLTFSNNYWTFGSRTAGTSTNSMSVGSDHVMNNQNTFAAGFGHTINNGSGAAFGTQNTVSGDHGFSVGWTNTSSGTASFTAGVGNIASQGSSMATGAATRASGLNSWSGGRGFTTGSRFLFASGTTSFNFSENTTDQVAGHGALANNSAILGGINHNIESGNVRAAVIGGSGIKLTGTDYIDHVAVPNLAIFSTPGDGGSDDVLTWNSTTKKIGKVSQASLGGGGGSGTVTSVAATAPAAGFTISGSPITTSGTLTFALANDLAGLENLSGTGLAVRTGTSTWTNRTIVGGTGISVTNGSGVSANPSIALSHLGIQNLSNPGADRIMFWDQSGSKAEWLTVDTNTLTISGTTLSANYGSGTAGQVAYWSGSNTLTGEAGFEYDEGSDTLTVENINLGLTTTGNSHREIQAFGSLSSVGINIIVKGTAPLWIFNNVATDGVLAYYPNSHKFGEQNGADTTTPFTIFSATGGANTAPARHGQDIVIKAGDGFQTDGDGNGGDITIQSGQRRTAGSGTDGDVMIDPLTGFLILANIPTSSAGLPSGAVWANNNVLTIVP